MFSIIDIPPVAIAQDDNICHRQANTKAASPRGEQEERRRTVLPEKTVILQNVEDARSLSKMTT
jgi:hypothetical protein